MTDNEEIPKDVSLLRCVVKKSANVAKKVGIVIGAIIGIAIACYLIYLGGVAAYPTLVLIGTAIITVLVAIPWWVYVGFVLIAAIPTYSFIWCVSRELTDDDWQSDIAKNFAFALAPAFAFALALAFAFALALALALALAFALALAALAALAADHKSILFVGAYLHYRKRIREQKKKEQLE